MALHARDIRKSRRRLTWLIQCLQHAKSQTVCQYVSANPLSVSTRMKRPSHSSGCSSALWCRCDCRRNRLLPSVPHRFFRNARIVRPSTSRMFAQSNLLGQPRITLSIHVAETHHRHPYTSQAPSLFGIHVRERHRSISQGDHGACRRCLSSSTQTYQSSHQ